jgi:hypothetical protein
MLPEIVLNLATRLSDYCLRPATRNSAAEMTHWFCFQLTATRSAKQCGVNFWWIYPCDLYMYLFIVKVSEIYDAAMG